MFDNFDYDPDFDSTINLELSTFDEIIRKCKGKRVCIFLGAGFSKAWDDSYPLSSDIFSISKDEAEKNKNTYNFFSLFESLNLKWADENASHTDKANVFKNFKYTIDIYKRYPSLLPSYLDKHTISIMEGEIKNYIKNKFKGLVKPSELKLTSSGKISKDKKNIIDFFKRISDSSELDIITTNYDIVIDKILHIMSKERSVLRGMPVIINNSLQCPKSGGIGLYKLNGGFEVIADGDIFKIDYDSIKDKSKTPNIILPSNEQDYSDKYFKNAFIKSSNQLRVANILIFIGYSFPIEDFIIQFLLKSFLDSSNKDKETIIMSKTKDSAIDCHSRACNIFKELDDKSGLYYLDKGFLELCRSIDST